MLLPNHGANPQRLYERLGLIPPDDILDFSENVNPAGVPNFIAEEWPEFLPLLERYPDPQGEPFLSAVADYHHVAKNQVMLGNGAAEIFSLLAQVFKGQTAIVVHPTFSEYEATLEANDVQLIQLICEDILTWQLPLEKIKQAMQQAQVIYLCTPNNPTGVMPPKVHLQWIIAEAKTRDCYVVLDEAFIDWIGEEASMIVALDDNPHIIIVRSMTKMYAIAGLRLGYMLAAPEIVNRLEKLASHWHINGLATVIGERCLQQEDYRKKASDYAATAREKFSRFLQHYHCQTTASVTNYISFQLPNPEQTQAFFQAMLERGIVLRHTENFRGMHGKWFRVGMKKPAAMERLEQEMATWLQQNSSL